MVNVWQEVPTLCSGLKLRNQGFFSKGFIIDKNGQDRKEQFLSCLLWSSEDNVTAQHVVDLSCKSE